MCRHGTGARAFFGLRNKNAVPRAKERAAFVKYCGHVEVDIGRAQKVASKTAKRN
jgi:hypothetical protein